MAPLPGRLFVHLFRWAGVLTAVGCWANGVRAPSGWGRERAPGSQPRGLAPPPRLLPGASFVSAKFAWVLTVGGDGGGRREVALQRHTQVLGNVGGGEGCGGTGKSIVETWAGTL